MQVLRLLIAVLAVAAVAVSGTETTEVISADAAVDVAAAEQVVTAEAEAEEEAVDAEEEEEEEEEAEDEEETEEEEESESEDGAFLEVDKPKKAKKAKKASKFVRPHMHRRGALRTKTIAFPVGYDQSAFRIDTVYADGARPSSTEQLFARYPKSDRRVVAHLYRRARPAGEYQFETPEYEADPHHPEVVEYHSAKAAHRAAKKAAKKAHKALKNAPAHATLADIARLERALTVALTKVGQHEARLVRIEAALKQGPATPAAAAKPAPGLVLQASANTAACAAQKGVCQTTTCAGTQVHNLCGAGAAVCCVTAPTLPVGEKGLDISVPLTATVAKCLKSNSYQWISIRAGRSTGKVDTNAPASIRTALANGFTPAQISVYIFPYSATSDSASGGRQVTAMWNSLASVKDSFSMIWLDIEKATWSTTANNQKFFESMLAACRATGKQCGVYTSSVYWQQIMGSTYKGGASLPVWYPHYNNLASLADWAPFGGWTSPFAKQWKGDTTICGVGADLNIKNAAFAGPTVSAAAPATSTVLRASAPAPASSSVTAAQLVACMTGLSTAKANTVLPFINAAQAQASINTCKRKSAWLAQLGHESGSLQYMQEIASGAAYEGRCKDLGNCVKGDGVKYKGRGPIQLTGRANYKAAGTALGLDLINNPTSVATNAVGFKTSAWFWTTKGLNAFADAGQFSTITTRINGGTNGAADRNARYAKCKKALGC